MQGILGEASRLFLSHGDLAAMEVGEAIRMPLAVPGPRWPSTGQ